MNIGRVIFSISYLIHVCMEEAILGFWKWFLEGVVAIHVWFVGRVYRTCRKSGIQWVEYRDPIDIWTIHQTWRLFHVDIKKEPVIRGFIISWINLMLNLETIMALTFMAYIVGLDAYELHAGDEKVFIDLLMNLRNLNYTYDSGSSLFKSIFVYLCWPFHINFKILHIHIVTWIFYHLNCA